MWLALELGFSVLFNVSFTVDQKFIIKTNSSVKTSKYVILFKFLLYPPLFSVNGSLTDKRFGV